MDELEISGKRFISTRLAAKQHKYHADYIGQLIRAKKIIGQKVGRSWYVDEQSLATYFGQETSAAVEPPAAVVAKAPVAKAAPEVVAEVAPIEKEEVVKEPAQEVVTPVAVVNRTPKVSEVFIEERVSAPVTTVVEESEENIEIEKDTVRDSIHIPIRVSLPSFSGAYQGSGLRYVEDEAPLLPEVTKNTNRKVKAAVSLSRVDNEEVYITEYAPQGSAGLLLPTFSIAVLGIVAFIIVAVSSVMINSNLVIEAGKAASSWYSLH